MPTPPICEGDQVPGPDGATCLGTHESVQGRGGSRVSAEQAGPPPVTLSADVREVAGVTVAREQLRQDIQYFVLARQQEDSQGVDAFGAFPSEQIAPSPPIAHSGIFIYVPAEAAPRDLVRTEPRSRRQRRARQRGDDSCFPGSAQRIRPRRAAEAFCRQFGHRCWSGIAKLRAASVSVRSAGFDEARPMGLTFEHVRPVAENAPASARDIASGLRTRLSTFRLREVLIPCVALLVGMQTGGGRIVRAELGVLRRAPQPIAVRSAIVRRSESSSMSIPPATPARGIETLRAVTPQVTRSVVTSLGGRDRPRSQAARTVMPETTGVLLVESQPTGGQVFLNGVPVGATPLALSGVRARAYAVRIDVLGYARWSRGIYVIAQQKTRVAAVLERDQ